MLALLTLGRIASNTIIKLFQLEVKRQFLRGLKRLFG